MSPVLAANGESLLRETAAVARPQPWRKARPYSTCAAGPSACHHGPDPDSLDPESACPRVVARATCRPRSLTEHRAKSSHQVGHDRCYSSGISRCGWLQRRRSSADARLMPRRVVTNGCRLHCCGDRCTRRLLAPSPGLQIRLYAKSNSEFWTMKVGATVSRDRRKVQSVRKAGWNVL